MSSIYALEPPTHGKVVLHTSIGDIDIELWPQQAPKACRNFVQLCMEGYYDGTIFHRVVKGFMTQSGDPTGTGAGGESIFGAPFKTESHSRLRFTHRGIAAMATPANTRDENGSQFFLTFDACEWLNGKHTIFGKVTGDTIFNVLSMQELEVGDNDRPENPPKIISCDVLLSPFDDIIPREKSASVEAFKKPKHKKKKRKNATLLSFADDEPIETSSSSIPMASSHDLADDDPMLAKQVAVEKKQPEGILRHRSQDQVPAAKQSTNPEPEKSKNSESERPTPALTMSAATQNDDEAELARLRAQVKSMKSRAFHVEKQRKEADKNSVLTPLEQRRQAYLKKRTTSRKQREEETLQKLQAFKSTLQSQAIKPQPQQIEPTSVEDDSDETWLKHSLAFVKRPQDFDPMAVDVQNYEYILTDPLAEQAGKKRRRSPPRA